MWYPEGAGKPVQRLYDRLPIGVARIFVAGVAGAVMTVAVFAKNGGNDFAKFWPWLAGVGLVFGLAGGVLLSVLERRKAADLGPPRWWLIFRQIAITLLYTTFVLLFGLLLYVMYGVARQNHLYGL